MLKPGWGSAGGTRGVPGGPTPPSSSETPYVLPEPFRWRCGPGPGPQAWLWAGSRAQQETAEDSLIG